MNLTQRIFLFGTFIVDHVHTATVNATDTPGAGIVLPSIEWERPHNFL